MNVVFLQPHYPPEMQQYTRGLAEVGARIWGVGDAPLAQIPEATRRHMHDYLQVPGIMNEADVVARVAQWLRLREIDRVLSNWEPLVLTAARLRERLGVPGMSVDQVMGFRDKGLMKERVRAAGLRVPRSRRARQAPEVWAAVEEIGFPMIMKPIAGAGSADTYRVEDRAQVEKALALMQHVREMSCEEYIDGEEFTFDTVSIAGQPAFMNVAQYLPKALEARSHEWISPIIVTVRDLAQPKLQGGIELGRKVLGALRMGDGFTHMEWFLTPKGEVVFGEIGCRPGGARLVDQMNYTCDIDLFREWARASCWGTFEAPTERLYNCAIIFKRAEGEGRITAIKGLGEFRRRYGKWIVAEELLPVGAPRRNWKNTLTSDGCIILRHPDWDRAVKMAEAAATNVKLFAG